LVKLKQPVTLNKYVKLVCLPLGLPKEFEVLRTKNYVEDIIGVRAHAIGWGYTSNIFKNKETDKAKFAHEILQYVDLPVLSNQECEKFYKSISLEDGKRMCAGAEKGKDSCRGDSGGPLVINKFNRRTKNLYPDNDDAIWIQVGVTSFGSSDCGSGKPGVYTRVSEYIDWIKKNLK
jgi:secreted trypsin-like serine protease